MGQQRSISAPAGFLLARINIMPENVSMNKPLTCPMCGKSTLNVEFPDQYEVWLKCSSCDFFMGMSNDEWHHMKNSPNINEKIHKMAKKMD